MPTLCTVQTLLTFKRCDRSPATGPSEQILGQFQKSWVEAGNAPLQILTKYVPNIFQSRVTPASVEGSIKKSLAALQMDSLDCVQMHCEWARK